MKLLIRILAPTTIAILFASLCLYFILHQVKTKSSPSRSSTTPQTYQYISHPQDSQLILENTPHALPLYQYLTTSFSQAKHTINAAIYSIDSVEIKQSLYQAANRGVKVTLVVDQKNHQSNLEFFRDKPTNLTLIESTPDQTNTSGSYSSYMHHKFAIIDDQTLFTGSFNWTSLQQQYDSSDLFETSESAIIKIFSQEFDRLKSGQNGRNKLTNSNYHPLAGALKFSDSNLEIWFSPGTKDNSIRQRLGTLIDSSQKDIKIMVWLITDRTIIDQLINKAKSGVKIQIITDDFNLFDPNSAGSYLLKRIDQDKISNIEVIDDSARTLDFKKEIIPGEFDLNPFFHHHVLISDDHTVLFGTNNWSSNGSTANDENILITDSSNIVTSFTTAFDTHYQQLRRQILPITLKNNQLTIDQTFSNSTIQVASYNQEKKRTFLCQTIGYQKTINLSPSCTSSYLDVFIIDHQGNVLGNSLIYKGSSLSPSNK